MTSRATALVASDGSSEPIGPMTPIVARTGSAADAIPGVAMVRIAAANANAHVNANATRRLPTSRPPRPPAIAHELLHGVHSGDAGDTATTVGRTARLVEAGDRRAEVGVPGRGPHVEELTGRQLTVEDVAAHQAVLVLHLVGTDHLPVQDRIGEAGCDGVDAARARDLRTTRARRLRASPPIHGAPTG